MKLINEITLSKNEAALWWLGQAGYIIRSTELTIVIDPYLSNSAAKELPEFSRKYPPPIKPENLNADIIIITHNHLDHLDPETLSTYPKKYDTWFVAPRLAAKMLTKLGIPEQRIIITNIGETTNIESVIISGIYALPTGIDVLDTTGYLITFANGRSIYHTGDTQYHPIVLDAAPKGVEVMLVPINGKWDNPGPELAARFALAVNPNYVIPNHYDMMELNAENPKVFQWFCKENGLNNQCKIIERMQPFIWSF